MLNILQQQSFDYEILDRQTRTTVQQKTLEIKGLIRQTAQDIVEVGQKLAAVKRQLKHGEFRSWLKSEFNWSVSSATKFMQVSEQFKNVDFAHFNFATSALYVLAAPSTPETARQYALEIASKGENITYSLAKLIIKHYKKPLENDSYYFNQLNSSTITQSDVQCASPVIDVELIPDNIAEKAQESVKILRIKQEKSPQKEDIIQDFEVFYAGTCVAVEGRPQDLAILFKKMQKNPQFAENIFQQASGAERRSSHKLEASQFIHSKTL